MSTPTFRSAPKERSRRSMAHLAAAALSIAAVALLAPAPRTLYPIEVANDPGEPHKPSSVTPGPEAPPGAAQLSPPEALHAAQRPRDSAGDAMPRKAKTRHPAKNVSRHPSARQLAREAEITRELNRAQLRAGSR